MDKTGKSKIFLWQKTILIILGIFLFFVLLEIGLRLEGFIFLSLQERRNIASIKQKGTYRIMCLGESTTAFGGKDSYPFQLGEVLNQRNTGIKFSVINEGAPGRDTPYILAQLEANLNKYRPDMVTAMMGMNDGDSIMSYEDISISKPLLFLKLFKVYKLTNLLWLQIANKPKEVSSLKSVENKEYTELKQYSSQQTPKPEPVNDDTSVELGFFYKNQGKFDQAEGIFKKAIELEPENHNAYLGLGLCYVEQRKFIPAEDLFKKAIELDSVNSEAYIELGWCYAGQGKFSQAEDLLKKTIERDPKNEGVYLRLGWCYMNQDKHVRAEELFKKAIELNPKNDNAYLGLALCYMNQDKLLSQAEDLLKKSIELKPVKSDSVYGRVATLCEERGKYNLAKKYYKKANELRLEYYNPITRSNYQKLKEILDKRGIRLVCVQYPVRSVEPIKKIFEDQAGVIFVDSERIFKEVIKKEGYKAYFTDMDGGDFGHCTRKGNRLLAENIANVILKEYFNR
jgi:Tfp pilus assembly protein PilF